MLGLIHIDTWAMRNDARAKLAAALRMNGVGEEHADDLARVLWTASAGAGSEAAFREEAERLLRTAVPEFNPFIASAAAASTVAICWKERR